MRKPEEPLKVFKLLNDYLTAENMLASFKAKQPSPEFEKKIKTSFTTICDLIDVELDKICDNAPAIEEKK